MNINNLNETLKESKSLSDLARAIFGKENYTNREKCKKILAENEIDWKEWLEEKKKKVKRFCLFCGKEITKGDSRKKFCNSSCATSYRNLRKTNKPKEVFCLNCGKPLNGEYINGKFCSNKCQGEYKHKEYIRAWKLGEKDGMSGGGGISKAIRDYLFEKHNNKCQICGWGEENPYTHKIPLQVHHIDGDCTNNKEENLQLLCPNCHSLTDTFGGINKNSKRVDRRLKYVKQELNNNTSALDKEIVRCIVCGKELKGGQTTFCSKDCMNKYRMNAITKEEILDIFNKNEHLSYEKAARLLNISRSCLRDKCKKFGILTEIQKMRFEG